MSKTAQHIARFGGNLIASKDTEDMEILLFDNDIVFVRIKPYKKVTQEVSDEGNAFLNQFGQAPRYFTIFEYASFSDIDPEVRTARSKEGGSRHSKVDAIVISSLAQKILADFYLKINKPPRPTRIFFSTEKAIDWIHSMIKKEKDSGEFERV